MVRSSVMWTVGILALSLAQASGNDEPVQQLDQAMRLWREDNELLRTLELHYTMSAEPDDPSFAGTDPTYASARMSYRMYGEADKWRIEQDIVPAQWNASSPHFQIDTFDGALHHQYHPTRQSGGIVTAERKRSGFFSFIYGATGCVPSFVTREGIEVVDVATKQGPQGALLVVTVEGENQKSIYEFDVVKRYQLRSAEKEFNYPEIATTGSQKRMVRTIMRIDVHDYVSWKDRILPGDVRIKVTAYFSDGATSLVAHHRLLVSKWTCEPSFPDRFFTFEFPEGATVADHDLGIVRIIGSDEVLALSTPEIASTSAESSGWVEPTVLIGSVFLLGVGIVLLITRRFASVGKTARDGEKRGAQS